MKLLARAKINWTLDDVNHLFNAIFEGSGQKK